MAYQPIPQPQPGTYSDPNFKNAQQFGRLLRTLRNRYRGDIEPTHMFPYADSPGFLMDQHGKVLYDKPVPAVQIALRNLANRGENQKLRKQ